MVQRLYTIFLYLMIPYILLRLYWKGRAFPAYKQRILERFSLAKNLPQKTDVWLHAVSLGEVVAATPLIESMLANNYKVLVTTMTPTGSSEVRARFADRVMHQYLPYDLPWCLHKFFKRTAPKVGVIMETELWPNLIYIAKQHAIPLILANARISDKAFTHYKKLKFFFKPILSQFNTIGTQSELDQSRYIALGASPMNVLVLGNMKFDLKIPVIDKDKANAFKAAFGHTRSVLIAASTHEGEEDLLLANLDKLKQTIPNLILLIAPRRPERFNTVYELSEKYQFKTAKRSQFETIKPDSEVVVLDSLGELLLFYAISDFAFVGGSLVPIGGHNVLEPIAMQVPVFCGPYMQNSKSICNELKEKNAILWVDGIDELIEEISKMYKNPESRAKQVEHASIVLKTNQGAAARYLEVVKLNLNNPRKSS